MANKTWVSILALVEIIVLGLFIFRWRHASLISRPALIFAVLLVLALALMLAGSFRSVFGFSLLFFLLSLAYAMMLYWRYKGITLASLMVISVLGLIAAVYASRRRHRRRRKHRKPEGKEGRKEEKEEEDEVEKELPSDEESPQVIIEKVSPKKANYVASATGSLYHVPRCPAAKKISRDKKLTFETEGEAKAKRLKPHNCIKA